MSASIDLHITLMIASGWSSKKAFWYSWSDWVTTWCSENSVYPIYFYFPKFDFSAAFVILNTAILKFYCSSNRYLMLKCSIQEGFKLSCMTSVIPTTLHLPLISSHRTAIPSVLVNMSTLGRFMQLIERRRFWDRRLLSPIISPVAASTASSISLPEPWAT